MDIMFVFMSITIRFHQLLPKTPWDNELQVPGGVFVDFDFRLYHRQLLIQDIGDKHVTRSMGDAQGRFG